MTFKELQNKGYTIDQNYTSTQFLTDTITNLAQFDTVDNDTDIAPENPEVQETDFPDTSSSTFVLFDPSESKQKYFDDLEELQKFVKSHSLKEIENELN